jgi:carbon-monoxide dehydrogenase large subunit
MITGAGRFVADIAPSDALVAWFVRSPFASGSIAGVEVEEAVAAPGVVAVYAAADLDLKDLPTAPPIGVQGMDQPMLARDRVAFVGQAVAVVIAESAALAEDAAGLVFVDIDPDEPVVSIDDAIRDETLVHSAAGTNIVFRDRKIEGPDLPAGLIDVTVTVDHPRLAPSPIETLTALAIPADGGLHIQVGSQSPHELQRQIAGRLDMPAEMVRVSVPDVGGAFGMKRFHPEYPVVARAALLLGRPVLWAQSRREIFLAGTHGRGQRHEVTLSATPDGRIHGARFRLLTDTGAYPHRGVMIPLFSRLVATGLYDIPRVDFEIIAATTNLPPTAPYRGAGRPEAALAIERAVDALARELDLDPADVRRRNFIADLPHETAMGARLDSGDYAEAFELGLQMARYAEVRAEQKAAGRGTKSIGIGIGAFIERTGGAPDSWEYGEVEIDGDGTVVARTGSTSAGQSHETAWRRVVAEVFDVAPSQVAFAAGDTAVVGDSVGSFASRSTQVGASAVWRCAERVRVAAAELVAEMLEAAPEDIRVSGGAFHVAGSADIEVTLAEVAAFAEERQVELRSEERYSPGVQAFPYGVHIATVEVDTDTGVVRPLSLVAVDDVGNVLDRMLLGGQVDGSVMQGLGAALFEEMHFSEDGQPQAATFVDYLVPSAMQSVPLATDHVSHPAPSNPLGAKGAGEGGCIGIPPAILNAALDALAPWGVDELQIPLTPNKVWTAIQRAAR